MTLRDRRIDSEWELLEALAAHNPTTLAAMQRSQDEFRVALHQSPAWVGSSAKPRIETEHWVRFAYPRFYPALPLEAYFMRPILHVNVDAASGFVCLWKDFRVSYTIVDAVVITRSIMAYRTANWEAAHCMQTDARMAEPESLRLPMPSLIMPENCLPAVPPRPVRRQRLWFEVPTPCNE